MLAELMARYVPLNQADWVLASKNQSTGVKEGRGGEKHLFSQKKIVCCWVLMLIGGERFDRRRGGLVVNTTHLTGRRNRSPF